MKGMQPTRKLAAFAIVKPITGRRRSRVIATTGDGQRAAGLPET